MKFFKQNRNFGQKSKFWSKIEIFVQKYKFWSKIDILLKNRILVKNIFIVSFHGIKKNISKKRSGVGRLRSKMGVAKRFVLGSQNVLYHVWIKKHIEHKIQN